MKKVNGFRISAKQTEDGWVKGTIDSMHFEAKVYNEGSQYGINDGRVSKLFIWDERARLAKKNFCAACTVVYERDWGRLPETQADMDMTDALVDYLDALPTLEFWEAIAEKKETIYTTLKVQKGYPTNVRVTIEHNGWAQVQDCLTGIFYKRLDPIAVMELLDSRK